MSIDGLTMITELRSIRIEHFWPSAAVAISGGALLQGVLVHRGALAVQGLGLGVDSRALTGQLGVHLRADLLQAAVDVLADGRVGDDRVHRHGAHAGDRRAVADGRLGRRRGGRLGPNGGTGGERRDAGAGGKRQDLDLHGV
jgi:hypothetical protein